MTRSDPLLHQLSSIAPEQAHAPERMAASDDPCHILDESGLTLCGAKIKPGRRVHSLTECIVEDHTRCQVCEVMDGGIALTTDGDGIW